MELGETSTQGAARETDEESGANIDMGPLFAVMNVVHVGQVHLFYLARLRSTVFNPGHETIEARMFNEQDIPWEELAFRTVREALQRYFSDRKNGHIGFHSVDVT